MSWISSVASNTLTNSAKKPSMEFDICSVIVSVCLFRLLKQYSHSHVLFGSHSGVLGSNDLFK